MEKKIRGRYELPSKNVELRVLFLLFIFSIPEMMRVDKIRKTAKMLRMRKYRASLSEEKKDIVRLFDRARKRDKRFEKTTPTRSSPNYNKVLYRSKKIRRLLGDDPIVHALVLSKVLKDSFDSPSKRGNVTKSLSIILSQGSININLEISKLPFRT